MVRGHRVWMFALIVSVGACDEFKAAGPDSVSGGGDGSSSGDEGMTTVPATTGGGTTAATDSAGDTTSSAGPTTDDPSSTSPSSDGETTAEPTTDPSTSGSTETTSDAESSSGEADSDPTTGPMVCQQQDAEPNDLEGETEFVTLGTIGCGATQYGFDGTIEDADDDDWMGYVGEWDCGSNDDPQVFIDVVDDNVEVCVSPSCVINATAYYNCVEGDNWTFNGNDFGCCSTDVVRMNVNCNGTADESLVASIRVRDSEAVCEDYALSYAYLVQ